MHSNREPIRMHLLAIERHHPLPLVRETIDAMDYRSEIGHLAAMALGERTLRQVAHLGDEDIRSKTNDLIGRIVEQGPELTPFAPFCDRM